MKGGKEMKKSVKSKVLGVVAKAALGTAKTACGAASFWGFASAEGARGSHEDDEKQVIIFAKQCGLSRT